MYALSVENLTKVYRNGLTALKGINLSVKEGDFFALLGKNGAGKSTTIGIVCSLINKTAGKVQVFGHDIDAEPRLAKSFIGVVPQEMNFNLFESITQILVNQAGYYGVTRRVAFGRAETYLKEMDLWSMRAQPAMRLSGGMKRRLMIARALMNEPKLLILDEPTAGVDIELRHSLWRLLTRLNQQGTTIILTTHYLEEAEYLCKNVAIIDHGDIIEHETMKSLVNRLPIQTVILDLATPLADPLVIDGYVVKSLDDTSLEVELPQTQTMNDLFEHLSKRQIIVTSMRNKTNRLEELFIHLVSDKKTS